MPATIRPRHTSRAAHTGGTGNTTRTAGRTGHTGRAVRAGHWVVLDELNLAPSEARALCKVRMYSAPLNGLR